MPVYPVPAGRSSDALLTQRLLAQLQTEQKEMLRVEQQLGTGRRIQLPSADASSAGRAVSLQRLLESKEQLQHNVSTGQSYLDATDTALSGVATLLSNARSQALLAADSTTSDNEREALSVEIESTINEMLRVGNQSFRGRYLFAGSDSSGPPFEMVDGYIAYRGNDVTYRSLGDRDLPFATNVSAQELFGAVSSQARGIDLNPVLTQDTLLSDLHGGRGIAEGSIEISDGVSNSTVSLAAARTLGDVLRLIEANPPEGRELHATIGARGLVLQMGDGAGGSLIARDVQGGTTATELGIARESGAAADPIVGADLDPVLRPTTALENVLGARAQTHVRSAGANNDIILEARDRGEDGNDYRLQFVDHGQLQAAPGLIDGNEYAELYDVPRAARASLQLSGTDNDLLLTANSAGAQWNNVQIEIDASQNLGDNAQVTFDAGSNTLLIKIDDDNETTLGTMVNAINASGEFTATSDASMGEGYDPASHVLSTDAGIRGNTGNSGGDAKTIYVNIDVGDTSANQVMEAIRAHPQINDLFEVRLDPRDFEETWPAGAGTIDVDATGITTGGTGTEWDQESGLQITHGGETHTIDISGAETIEDLLNIFNGSDAMLLAEINGDRTGINVRSRLSGSDFSIGENGGTTATDLGLRTLARTTPLADVNYRQGITPVAGADFVIHRNDGVDLEIDASSAKTVGDVIDLINDHPDNQNPDTAVVAALRPLGNGIQLVDDNPDSGESLTVATTGGSAVAWELGLVPWGGRSPQSVDPPAEAADALVTFAAPHNTNTAFRVEAVQAGTGLNGIDIELRNTVMPPSDTASATFDPVGGRLTIDMADGHTTANTVVDAIIDEGTFTAELDFTSDPSNDGNGTLVAPPGAVATTANGTPETFAGEDANPIATEGIFNTLLRLHDAIDNHEVEKLERIVAMFDADFDRLNFGRAVVGASSRALDSIRTRNEDDQVELKAALSKEIDVDLAKAVSDFTARRAGYEASLRSIGNMYRLSLLDFL